MNILITGGAGYIGSILVHKLFQAKSIYTSSTMSGHELHDSHALNFDKITVYDNLMYKQVCLTDFCHRKEFNFIQGDVRDWSNLKKYVDEADVIIPLAAIVGFPACEKDPQLAYDVNTRQIQFIAANKKSHQKIIFPNTNSGYGINSSNDECTEESPLNPISVYGKTKCEGESIALQSEAIVLRLATVFGVSPRMRLDLLVNDFVYKAFNDGYIVLFEKNFRRNFIHIQDVALAIIKMIKEYDSHKGQVFNLGLSDANLSKFQLCEKIKEQIPKFSIQSDEIAKDLDKRDYIVSNKKIESIGWSPKYSLENGIEELIKAYSIIGNYNKKFTNL